MGTSVNFYGGGAKRAYYNLQRVFRLLAKNSAKLFLVAMVSYQRCGLKSEGRKAVKQLVISTLLMPNLSVGYAVLYHHKLEKEGLVRRQNGVAQNPFPGLEL